MTNPGRRWKLSTWPSQLTPTFSITQFIWRPWRHYSSVFLGLFSHKVSSGCPSLLRILALLYHFIISPGWLSHETILSNCFSSLCNIFLVCCCCSIFLSSCSVSSPEQGVCVKMKLSLTLSEPEPPLKCLDKSSCWRHTHRVNGWFRGHILARVRQYGEVSVEKIPPWR